MMDPNDPLIRILRNLAGDAISGKTNTGTGRMDAVAWKLLVDAVGSELGSIATAFFAPSEDPGHEQLRASKTTSAQTQGASRGTDAPTGFGFWRTLSDAGEALLDQLDDSLAHLLKETGDRPDPAGKNGATTSWAAATDSPDGNAAPAAGPTADLAGRTAGDLACADLGSTVTIATERIAVTGTIHDVRHSRETTGRSWTYLVLRAEGTTGGIELRLDPAAGVILEPGA